MYHLKFQTTQNRILFEVTLDFHIVSLLHNIQGVTITLQQTLATNSSS